VRVNEQEVIATRWATLDEVRRGAFDHTLTGRKMHLGSAGLAAPRPGTTPRRQATPAHPPAWLPLIPHWAPPHPRPPKVAAEMAADPEAFTQWAREELPLLPRA
jgi:hypothetical protein